MAKKRPTLYKQGKIVYLLPVTLISPCDKMYRVPLGSQLPSFRIHFFSEQLYPIVEIKQQKPINNHIKHSRR